MTVMRWCAQDDVDQEESEQNEVDGLKKGADSTGAYVKERLVICNGEDTGPGNGQHYTKTTYIYTNLYTFTVC